MGRKKLNQTDSLTLAPDGPEHYRLFGYVRGKQIRRRSKNLAELEKMKADLELEALKVNVALADRRLLPPSWLTPDQLRDAENALHTLMQAGSSLTLAECVAHGLKVLGEAKPTPAADAVKEYLDSFQKRELSTRHYFNTESRLRLFFEAYPAKMISDVTSQDIARYCYRSGVAGYTRLSDAITMQAFMTFCVERRMLRVSPCELDMRDFRKLANKGRPRPVLLRPEQCAQLLQAAIETDGGNHVPYLIFSLWCGIRRAEVERLNVNDLRLGADRSYVMIHAGVAKTASYRKVVIPPNMVPLLRECVERGLIDHEPIGPALRRGWDQIRAKAGLVQIIQRPRNNLVKNTGWQGNILRHTGISYYYQLTGSVQETARQAGHSTEISFKHYIDLAQEDDAKAFYAITGTLTGAQPVPMVA